jgi:hypothetical protein
MDQAEKIVISKKDAVKSNLLWGVVCIIAAIGGIFMFFSNFLDLGLFSLLLAIGAGFVGGINLYIYRSKPSWFIQKKGAFFIRLWS